MNPFTNNPLTSHPLADQAEWWATDKSIKDAESIINNKTIDPVLAPYPHPTKNEEGGQLVNATHGSLTRAAMRTKEGVIRV